VFERFRQADSSSTRPQGGLGIGLALVKNLTELHGGTVGAESPGRGHGSTFRIRLPLPDPVVPSLPERDDRA
jgi:signal transduction histidine kinase